MNEEMTKSFEALLERNLGKYVLPFKVDIDETEERESNVVYISSKESRMFAIIEQLEDGSYQDWYFNANEEQFKPLTWNTGDDYYDMTFRESWIEEEMSDKLPEPFRSYVPKSRS